MEIIFIVLLSCALVASLLFLWLYRKAFWVLYQKKELIAQYECMLLLNIFYNYDFEGRAVDFSRYETQGLIVYNCFHDAKNSPKDGIVSSFYKQAFVYELDDGTFEMAF